MSWSNNPELYTPENKADLNGVIPKNNDEEDTFLSLLLRNAAKVSLASLSSLLFRNLTENFKTAIYGYIIKIWKKKLVQPNDVPNYKVAFTYIGITQYEIANNMDISLTNHICSTFFNYLRQLEDFDVSTMDLSTCREMFEKWSNIQKQNDQSPVYNAFRLGKSITDDNNESDLLNPLDLSSGSSALSDEQPPLLTSNKQIDEITNKIDVEITNSNLSPSDQQKAEDILISAVNNIVKVDKQIKNELNKSNPRTKVLNQLKEMRKEAIYDINNFREEVLNVTTNLFSHPQAGSSDFYKPGYQRFMYDKYFGDRYAGERGYKYNPSQSYVPKSDSSIYTKLKSKEFTPEARTRKYRETPTSFENAYKDLFNKRLTHPLVDDKYENLVKLNTNQNAFTFEGDRFADKEFKPGKSMRQMNKDELAAIKRRNEAMFRNLDFKKMEPEEIQIAAKQLLNPRPWEQNYDENGINLLANLIAYRQHNIKHNPKLAAKITAEQWLDEQITKYPHIYTDWFIETGDFDHNPNTPETVLIKDSKGRIQFVDGYSLGSGVADKRKKMLYNLYPNEEDRRAFNSTETESKLRSLVYKWFDLTDSERSGFGNDFATFARAYIAKHPKFKQTPDFRIIHSYVSYVLKGYKARDQLDERYKRLYISCLARTASFFNELIKNKISSLNLITSENNRDDILRVFSIMYEFAKERNAPHELAPELPLKGWNYFSNF
jgi:hypothetical protein